MIKDSLGDIIKKWESSYTYSIPNDYPAIVRLDGRRFSLLTKLFFDKPFSEKMQKIMSRTAYYIFKETHADISYVQSDEISLVYLPKNKERFTHSFGGKIQKLASTLAAQTTLHFNLLGDSVGVDKLDIQSFTSFGAHFDCRVFTCDNKENMNHEIAMYYLWRHKDCIRNAINQYAQSKFSHKKLQKLSIPQVLELIPEFDISIPLQSIYGEFLFRDKEKLSGYYSKVLIKSYDTIKEYLEGVNNGK